MQQSLPNAERYPSTGSGAGFGAGRAPGAAILLGILGYALTLISPRPCLGWGPSGHQFINAIAADALPQSPLRTLFQAHRAYLVSHSLDPDEWRKKSAVEGFHHYIDIDKYGKSPFLDLPRQRQDAEKKYGVETVLKNGVVPWTLGEWFVRCVDDMRSNNTSRVLMDAAVIGHYGADSHVPFHAVENYDGQLTGQKGIHARFETMLVNHYVKAETLKPSPVRYLDDPVSAEFGWLEESALLAPGILAADKDAHSQHVDYDSDPYRDAFWAAVGPVVTQRLQEGAGDVASLWYSAWIAAGQPLLDAPVTEIIDTAPAVADSTKSAKQ